MKILRQWDNGNFEVKEHGRIAQNKPGWSSVRAGKVSSSFRKLYKKLLLSDKVK